jgi:MoaA/NifB/PqqE/SkfB family radical SAM enzyme
MDRRWDRLRKHLRYVTRYPGVMPRAAANYARMILGQERLRGVEFALTYACPGRCGHCSAAFLRRDDRPLLTLEEKKSVVRQCLALGALNINLTGGECLTLPELSEVVKACRPRRTVVSLATNGLLLDERHCDDIARWGVSIVTVSLDSANPTAHDAGRGIPGLFERIMRGVDLLQARGVEVFLCTILTRQNIADGDAEAMQRLAVEKNVMLTVNLPCPVGGWAKEDVLLDEAQRAFHREFIIRPHVRWEGSSNYFRMGCPAGVEKLYLSPYGDVMPCNFLHVSYGNLRERALADIWRDILTRSPFNRVHDRCLIAEDTEFLRDVIEPIDQSPRQPIPVGEHPTAAETLLRPVGAGLVSAPKQKKGD